MPTTSSHHGIEPVAVGYREPSYGYSYHHPTRIQSLSVGSIHPPERTPFSAGAFGGNQFQDTFLHMGEYNAGVNVDNKQRKRRGNLPKETTDKLRAWFLAHLLHPYPTEDEKQDLMRQTGLQMSESIYPFVSCLTASVAQTIGHARAVF